MLNRASFKRININLDARLHGQFKAAAAVDGKKMTDVIVRFVESYVRDSAKPSRARDRR